MNNNVALFGLILLLTTGGTINITQTLLLLALLSSSGENRLCGCGCGNS